MLAGYDHLLAAARRLQWDEAAIDLTADAARVAALPAGAPALGALTELIAGFCLAESAVAAELEPFAAAAGDAGASGAPDRVAGECFVVQAADEARHARFFDRAAREVLGAEPATLVAAAARPALVELFDRRLPELSGALARGQAPLADAVGLYHLVLEGIVFAVGQDALVALAGGAGLPGIADGAARVQADERWHVGLGVLCLQHHGARVDVSQAATLGAQAWGPAIATPERLARVLAAHRRRLAIAHAPLVRA